MSFFGQDFLGGFRFFGTSGAAPNVAAVAAILLQIKPDLTPLEIYEVLEETAIDMNQVGFDFATGHGFVDALAAVEQVLPKSLRVDASNMDTCDFTYPELKAAKGDKRRRERRLGSTTSIKKNDSRRREG